MRRLVLAAAALLVAAVADDAVAGDLMTPTGGRGQLVLQQVAGFRAGSTGGPGGSSGGVGYLGMLGFSYDDYTQDQPGGGSVTSQYTSFWLTPSADFFPIDHLSLGGLLEISTTGTSLEIADARGNKTHPQVPTSVNFTLLPRVGWMFRIGDRFGVWPRVGAGFAYRELATTPDKTSFSGFILDADATGLVRLNETFFFGLTPELTFVPGTASVAARSASASDFSFAISAGIGVIL